MNARTIQMNSVGFLQVSTLPYASAPLLVKIDLFHKTLDVSVGRDAGIRRHLMNTNYCYFYVD